MFGANSILDIGRTGLNAAQAGISVTSENIANVDTAGYSRRTVRFEEAYNIDYMPGQVGTGVWAAEIQRHFDQFVETQYYNQATMRDRWEQLYSSLQGTESLFNESTGYGLSNSITNFFNSWQDLTQKPEDAGSRTEILENTRTLISTLHQADADLVLMQQQADLAINQQVGEVNDLLKQIADLNKQIRVHTSETNSANQLLDSRSQLVRKLAGYMDINYIDKGNGNLSITTKAGQTLVDNEQAFTLSYDAPMATNALMGNSTFASPVAGNASMGGAVYFQGNDNVEYTLEIVNNGSGMNVTSGAGAASFRVSVDGGNTWLKNEDGTDKLFYARPQDDMVQVGNIKVWFGTQGDSDTAPTGLFTAGDRFLITPKRALYWNENTSTKENITPQTNASGVDNTSRLTGGSLTALFSFKDDYAGKYRERMDALAKSTIWEVNRIHSQGAGLSPLSDVLGTYSVADDTRALGSGSSGLYFADKLTSGATNMYFYNTSTGLLASGGALDFDPATPGQQNFDPAQHSLNDVRDAINTTYGTYVTASIVNHKLSIVAKNGYTFAFGTDSAGLNAALGLNTYFTGTNCRDMGINDKVTTNTDYLNAGHVNGAGEMNKGDITTAKGIAELTSTKVNISTVREGISSQTIVKYYDSLVATVGTDTAAAKYNYAYKQTLAQDLDDRQQATSGVNLDEEMTSLIKYQHAYTAAAKLITTADQMLQTLLSLKS